MDTVEVVVAHSERATLRVGDVFVKVDADATRTAREVAAMELAPVPTPDVLWRRPPALALAAVPGQPLGHLGDPSAASAAAWRATGATLRALHDGTPPPWTGRSADDLAESLDHECEWLAGSGILPPDLVERNRRLAETALREWTPAFIHGDLQVDHVFIADDEVSGIIDWSEAAPGDAHFDLATLTLGHPGRLDDVLVGYGRGIDRGIVRAWQSLRCLSNIRWLSEHGFGPPETMPEVALLRSD